MNTNKLHKSSIVIGIFMAILEHKSGAGNMLLAFILGMAVSEFCAWLLDRVGL